MFEQSCNEVIVSADADEVGNEALGLPVVCVETSQPPKEDSGTSRSPTPVPLSTTPTLPGDDTFTTSSPDKIKEDKQSRQPTPFSLSRLKEVRKKGIK